MSCIGYNCGHPECRGDQLEAAQKDFLNAALDWCNKFNNNAGLIEQNKCDQILLACCERFQSLQQPLESPKASVCEYCGSDEDVTFEPDPYSEEINNDSTEHWICTECYRKSAWEI